MICWNISGYKSWCSSHHLSISDADGSFHSSLCTLILFRSFLIPPCPSLLYLLTFLTFILSLPFIFIFYTFTSTIAFTVPPSLHLKLTTGAEEAFIELQLQHKHVRFTLHSIQFQHQEQHRFHSSTHYGSSRSFNYFYVSFIPLLFMFDFSLYLFYIYFIPLYTSFIYILYLFYTSFIPLLNSLVYCFFSHLFWASIFFLSLHPHQGRTLHTLPFRPSQSLEEACKVCIHLRPSQS